MGSARVPGSTWSVTSPVSKRLETAMAVSKDQKVPWEEISRSRRSEESRKGTMALAV